MSKRLKIDELNINKFVKNILNKYENPYIFNPHFEKQYDGFYCDGNILVDELVKIENIDELNKLFEKLNLKNDTISNKTKHNEQLDLESIEIIKKIYQDDLKYLYNDK